MNEYTSVIRVSEYTYEDRKSVFIGEISPASTEAEALAFLEHAKKKYPDAKHHVFAYILRENNLCRFSDDGEPQGTAGLPVLDLLKKQNVTDVVAVVTRYFGGTLLGTGGLVRAYTEAAAGALRAADTAVFSMYTVVSFCVSYGDYQRLGTVAGALGFRTLSADFSENVSVTGCLKSEFFDAFCKKMSEMTGGKIKISVIEKIFSS